MMRGLKRTGRKILQPFVDTLLVTSQTFPGLVKRALQDEQATHALAAEQIKHVIDRMPSVAARFYPYRENQPAWFIPKAPEPGELGPQDGLPIPPQDLWAGYGANAADYLSSGQAHYQHMLKVLAETGYSPQPGQRILDFGCAAGRMTRCWINTSVSLGQANPMEVWGSDLGAEHIQWCQQYLSPPLNFVTNTTFPHLPFEDHYFDLIYAGSVFTHIGDLEDSWLMELRRILHPGGRMFITVHDNHTIQIFLNSQPGDWLYGTLIRQQLLDLQEETNFVNNGFRMFMTSRDPGNTQVFHDREYLRARWGRFLQILVIVPEAYGYQTAVIMTK